MTEPYIKAMMGDTETLWRTIHELRAENERLQEELDVFVRRDIQHTGEIERLRAALVEISELELEGDASLADAIHIAEEALNP